MDWKYKILHKLQSKIQQYFSLILTGLITWTVFELIIG